VWSLMRRRYGQVVSAASLKERDLWRQRDERPSPKADDPRRKYYRVTSLGEAVSRAEASRLQTLLGLARRKDLLGHGEA